MQILDKGDIVNFCGQKILIIGYDKNMVDNYLQKRYDIARRAIVIDNYLTNKEVLNTEYLYYFYLDVYDSYGSMLHCGGFNGREDLIHKTGKNYTNEEVQTFLIKKKMLGLLVNYDVDCFVNNKTYLSLVEERKNQSYLENISIINDIIKEERENFNKIFSKKKKLNKKSYSELCSLNFSFFFFTSDKEILYLYLVRDKMIYYVGTSLLKNKEECFRLYLRTVSKYKYTPENFPLGHCMLIYETEFKGTYLLSS